MAPPPNPPSSRSSAAGSPLPRPTTTRFKAQFAELEAAKTREEYEAILLKYGAEPEIAAFNSSVAFEGASDVAIDDSPMWERDLIGGQQEGERPKDKG